MSSKPTCWATTMIGWLFVLWLATAESASAQSIHPFFKIEDAVAKQEFVGNWELDRDTALKVELLGDNSYGLTLRLDQNMGICFRARLFMVGESYFLDGQVVELKVSDDREKKPDGEQPVPESESCHFKFDKTDFLLNRLHGLFLVAFSADNSSVSISPWQDEWLPKMADAGKLPVAHTKDDLGRLLLTAETEDLSDWVKDLPKDAFDKERVLTRRDGKDGEEGSSGNAN